MKKTLLFSFLLTIVVTSVTQAQITKGSKLLGGNLSYGESKLDNGFGATHARSSAFNINPAMGIAIKENLVVGIGLGYSTGKQKQLSAPANVLDIQTQGYIAGVFVRKYKQLAKTDFYLFGEAELGYNYMKQERKEQPAFSTRRKENTIYLGVKPGIAYAVNNRLHLELGLNNLFSANYSFSREYNYQITSTVKRTGFDVSTNITSLTNNISFGVRFLLAK